VRQDKSYSDKNELISWQTMVVYALDRLLWKIDATGSAERKYIRQRQKTHCPHELGYDAVEELVVSQEDAPAPGTHRTVRHFEHKKMTWLWIWLSHVGNFCYFWHQFVITCISETVMIILSKFATFTPIR